MKQPTISTGRLRFVLATEPWLRVARRWRAVLLAIAVSTLELAAAAGIVILHLPPASARWISTAVLLAYAWRRRKRTPRSGRIREIEAHTRWQQTLALRFRRRRQWRDEHRMSEALIARLETLTAVETRAEIIFLPGL